MRSISGFFRIFQQYLASTGSSMRFHPLFRKDVPHFSTIYLFLLFFVEVKSGVFEISRRFLFFMTSQICLFQIFDAVQRGSNFHKPISYNNHLRIPVSRCESQFRRIRGTSQFLISERIVERPRNPLLAIKIE